MQTIRTTRRFIPTLRINLKFQPILQRAKKSTFLLLSNRGWFIKPSFHTVLLIVSATIFALSVTMLITDYAQGKREENVFKQLAVVAVNNIDNNMELPAISHIPISTSSTTPSSIVIPMSMCEPVILSQYRELYKQNPDMVGWIKIGGTEIDYPVMYSADDFYLSHGFNKEASKSGVPFIDKRCSVGPFGTNTIIYGHHMKNGTMFAGLENYKDEDFFREYPVIRFDTLYTQQEYEIIAVFESQIYHENDTVFKHYDFLNAESQADFDSYITDIKALALYDTGVTASYGDELLTLVTCAYHTENGQFVVVARKAYESFN